MIKYLTTAFCAILFLASYCSVYGGQENADATAALDSTQNKMQTPASPAGAEKKLPHIQHEQTGNSMALDDAQDEFTRFRKTFTDAVDEILKELRRDYPELADSFNDSKKNQLLAKFAESLGDGIKYIPPGKSYPIGNTEKNSVATAKRSNTVISVVLPTKEKILYFRTTAFTDKAVSQLEKSIKKKPIHGIILDLRSSQGTDYKNIIKALSLLVPAEKLEETGITPESYHIKYFPLAVIADGKTSGASEVLISLLLQSKSAVFFGAATSGHPFPLKSYPLESGGVLMIPSVPKKLAMVTPKPVQPSIKTSVSPAASYEQLQNNPENALQDTCIRKAADLIICVASLKKDRKNEQKQQ